MWTKFEYDRVKSASYKLGLPLIIESPSTPMSRALWNSVNGNSRILTGLGNKITKEGQESVTFSPIDRGRCPMRSPYTVSNRFRKGRGGYFHEAVFPRG